MAIQFADPGGEYYYNTGLSGAGTPFSTIWDSYFVATTSLVSNAPSGRATTYAIGQGPNGSFITKYLSTGFATLVVGAAIYIPANWLPVSNATVLLQLYYNGNQQVDVRCTSAGNLYFTRNGSAALGGVYSVNALANGSGWHYVEAQFTVNNVTGAAQVWVDNVSWLSVSGQNTRGDGANNLANQVRFYNSFTNGQPTTYWKDMYILDTGTGVNTSRLGDITVGVEYPNAAGVNNAWTPNTGTPVSTVQDGITYVGTWPDGDTTYIADGNIGDTSDFAHQALSLTGTIYGVVHASYLRKDDAGSRSVAQVCISNGTTETGVTISLGNSYVYYFDVLENDPHTAAPWTLFNFNNATFGTVVIT